MKRKTAVGNIQNEAAVLRTHADVGDLREFRPRSLTTVRRCHRGFAHLLTQPYFRQARQVPLYLFQAARIHTPRRFRCTPNC